jgi:hypothetical protein
MRTIIPKTGCIRTATKVTQETGMSFYRRDFSPSKHKNVLCIVSNKGFFLWWWDDCTWSSLSLTVKAVTSEKIKHKKGLVYWPCLPLQKMYCSLCVLSQTRNVSVFRKEVYLKTNVLEAQISLITSLFRLWAFEMWGGLYEYVVGKESRSVETHVFISWRNFPVIHACWCGELYLVGKQMHRFYYASLTYLCFFIYERVSCLPRQHTVFFDR